MNEETEAIVNKVLKLIELWEDDGNCRANALELQMKLTILKLMVGIDKFDQLPAFVRVLKEVTDFIADDDKRKAEFAIARTEIKQSIDAMKEVVA